MYAHQNTSSLKIPSEKYKSLGLLAEFYTTSLYVSDIGADSFAHFQLDALNSDKDKYVKKNKKHFLKPI